MDFLNKKDVATIKITRVSATRIHAKIQMPIWKNQDKSGMTTVVLGLLGGLMVLVDKPELEDQRIQEAVKSFFIASEKYGKGIQEELKKLGWQVKPNSIKYKSDKKEYKIPVEDPFLLGIIRASETKSISVQMAA